MQNKFSIKPRHRLPSFIQATQAECGSTCLAMVAAYFGHSADIRSYRQSENRGMTITQLMKLGETKNLNCRALQCEITELQQFDNPLICHWDHSHFVVLKSCTRKYLVIHDPAVGVRKLTLEKAKNHFTGVVLEVLPGLILKPRGKLEVLGFSDFLSNQLRGLVPTLAQIILLALLLQGLALLAPFYTQLIIDEVLIKQDADLLLTLAVGFTLITLISAVTSSARDWAGMYLTNQLAYQLGSNLYQHLMHLPVKFFKQRHMGDIVSRFSSVDTVQQFFTSSAITVILDGLMAITTLIVVFSISSVLAWIVIATILFNLLLRLIFYPTLKLHSNENLVAAAKLDSSFMESIRAISVFKRMGLEMFQINNWQNRFSETMNTEVRITRINIILEFLTSIVGGVTSIALMYVGAKQVLNQQLTMGMLFAFLAYKSHLQAALSSLVGEYMAYLMLSLHFERLSDIKLEPIESNQLPARELRGSLELKNLSFRYGNDSDWIIKNLSMRILPNSETIIFGPSGTGKSTLLDILQASIAPTSGQVLYDGLPLSVTGKRSLQQGFASVMQEDQLLAGTIKSNIALGETLIESAALEAAAKAAEIHTDIVQMPMAYESLVGELGNNLSAGQIQRILIARALYRLPKVLILDEGTAHLDSKTANKVISNIRALGITRIMVTHAKPQLASADTLIFLERGAHKLHHRQLNSA